ncbi:hypothetical protein JTE90_020049 [Oedothorax gibbosus]|uniref:Uncharacterized protein n=2 Tax=Oedothorax gibbosus TaxID=931172 RepID=A0AAV6URY8_9ARAC|nr:hypothetical protein JTE90_020049 [Oedothorax gibbosus]
MEGKISNLNAESESTCAAGIHPLTINDNHKDKHKSGTSESKSTSVSEHEANTSENENIFQKGVRKLLRVRQLGKSQSETFDLYMSQLNGLYSDHIDSLVSEKSNLNIELQNVQKKHKENTNLTVARVDTLLTVLRSWAESDKFSDKNVKKAIQEKIKYYINFKKILIQLSERSLNSTHCPIYKGDSITRRVETNLLRREMKEKDDEIEELKKELQFMVKNQHSEQKNECKILSVFKCADDNCFLKLLIQTQIGLELLNEEVNIELKEIHQTISNNKKFEDDCLSEDSQNASFTKELSSKPSIAKDEANFLNQQLEVLQNKLKAFRNDFISHTSVIRKVFNNFQANEAEDMCNAKLSVGAHELEKLNSVHPELIQAILKKSNAEVKLLQEELSAALEALTTLQMDCNGKEAIINALEEGKKRAAEQHSQLKESMKGLENQQMELQKEVDETNNVLERCDRLFKQTVQQEKLTAKKLKDAEKKVKTLQSQLAGTQHELTIISRENSRLKNFQKTMK